MYYGAYIIYLLSYIGTDTTYEQFINSFNNQDLLMVVNSVGCLINLILIIKFVIPFFKLIYNALKFHTFKNTKGGN